MPDYTMCALVNGDDGREVERPSLPRASTLRSRVNVVVALRGRKPTRGVRALRGGGCVRQEKASGGAARWPSLHNGALAC